MWYGRYQLGQEMPISLLTDDASGVPHEPDVAPWLKIWAADGTLEFNGRMPAFDRHQITGLFQAIIFLDPVFHLGVQNVAYGYTLNGTPYLRVGQFEIVAGGGAGGDVQSLHWFHKPHGEFVVQQYSSGAIAKGRNPKI